MLPRTYLLDRVHQALKRSRVVALIGPRQCGKTTLARQIVPAGALEYFDLENPRDLGRLDEPLSALENLRGIVVIDEVQRRPDLFPVLRVLADRTPLPARFVILGSASPNLLRQSSESLAGRIERVPMGGSPCRRPALTLTRVIGCAAASRCRFWPKMRIAWRPFRCRRWRPAWTACSL